MPENKKRPFFHVHHQVDFETAKRVPTPHNEMHKDGFDNNLRSVFANALRQGADEYWSKGHNSELPVFGTFTMKPDSLAKSSRVPFINSMHLDLVSNIGFDTFVFRIKDTQTLNKMANKIEQSDSKVLTMALSYVSSVGVYSPKLKEYLCKEELLNSQSQRVWVKLFPSNDDKLRYFFDFLRVMNLPVFKEVHLYPDSNMDVSPEYIPRYVEINSAIWTNKLDELFSNSLVQSVFVPSEIVFDIMEMPKEIIDVSAVEKRKTGHNYPKIAILDSGVSGASYLNEWKLDRAQYVPEAYCNYNHGTFVTGRALMLDDSPKFGGIEFLDICAIPDRNSKTYCTIEDLKIILEENLEKYADQIKVWNLSIGIHNKVISDDEFSEIAKVLDAFQYKYKVVFVIAAGNCKPQNMSLPALSNSTKITQGADSVHGVTVGSISHMPTKICPEGFPSPFSRHGRGPNYIVKPDLVEFGGTLDHNGSSFSLNTSDLKGNVVPTGVISVNANNAKHWDCGTSYSTPRVAGTLARLYDQMKEDDFSVLASRTLIIHHAENKLRNVESELSVSYCGWGKPSDIDAMLYSNKDEATLVYEGLMPTDQEIVIQDIPIPIPMLENGKLKGDISMTAVYMPPTVPSMASLYTAIDLDFKVGYIKPDNGEWAKVIRSNDMITGILPSESEYYEKQRIQYGFKWHPVKKYFRSMRGIQCPETLLLRIVAVKREFYSANINVPFCVAISFKRKGKEVYESIRQQLAASHLKVSQAKLKIQV